MPAVDQRLLAAPWRTVQRPQRHAVRLVFAAPAEEPSVDRTRLVRLTSQYDHAATLSPKVRALREPLRVRLIAR
jgi:hypothetical protein